VRNIDVSEESGEILIALARGAIAHAFGERRQPRAEPSWLSEPGATFVTLRKHGELRGCVGTLLARQSLSNDVKANALGAAFRDSRFPRLRAAEFAATTVEVSLLSSPQPIEFRDEPDLLRQ
jgi:AmmeMemoRadiSam system protein A